MSTKRVAVAVEADHIAGDLAGQFTGIARFGVAADPLDDVPLEPMILHQLEALGRRHLANVRRADLRR